MFNNSMASRPMCVAVDGLELNATQLRGTLVAGKSACAFLVSDAGKFLS
jgi:hypothetical protein